MMKFTMDAKELKTMMERAQSNKQTNQKKKIIPIIQKRDYERTIQH